MTTETEQEVHVPTAKEFEQLVHADVCGIPERELQKAQKEEAQRGGGGSICICRRKGCRIGPMLMG